MGKLFVFYLTVCGFLLCMSFSPFIALAASEQPKTIFIVSSYDSDDLCGFPQYHGVLEAVAKAGFKDGENIIIHTYAMDSKKTNNTPSLIKSQGEIVLAKIKDVHPDVVVVVDDNAFGAVALKLVDSDVQIVFSGLNGQPEDYNDTIKWMDSRQKPGHNITGVIEKLHFVEAFKVQKKIMPGLTKAVIISDDSFTGKAVIKQIHRELSEESVDIAFEFKVSSSWESYKKLILKISSDPSVGTIYPAATLLKDKNGVTHDTAEIIRWTVKNSRKPEIPINYSFAQLGMLGGAGVDFISMGRQAGTLVALILNGHKAGDLPIEDAKRYAFVFNLSRAKELGINIPSDILMASDAIYR
ncbi:ABC transporter substrate-binding protein [Desulfovibrio gilichinskyi]|uniref:ABC-type uncharacterized transport system, substrate-binding protein n=1 Tax=Desulfovibrio gilichinskyi TaxID=1519643 RepID=A0A1X7DM39_9BACT|nr:ABC transporter substrate binding protein [Desulfovibrio gilichinskyi]SMF17425.1 ABC-type uncharacterized transport system, substrate-binding protein [Desulfovibrio gilichinskyi]